MSTFEGQMIEFKDDTKRRLDSLETKIDKALDGNRQESAVISGVTSAIISVISFFGYNHR